MVHGNIPGRRGWQVLVVVACLVLHQLGIISVFAGDEPDAYQIVKNARDHWRGLTSYSEMTMTIHRPDWERSMSMRVWTEGQSRSLVRVTAPKKDAGNGTLLVDKSMWVYSPRINRIIKIPSSMMNQSWMGSDFSNNDVSRADDILDQYEHSLIDQYEQNGKRVYVIESIPHEDASVVWGREILRVSEDNILLAHEFFDQEGRLVKSLQTLAVSEMGGRVLASRQRMRKTDRDDEWTEIVVDHARYEIPLDKNLFTRANLRNPRE